MSSKFKRGSGVFACRNCGRRTRDVNNGNGDITLCGDCYDGCAAENTALDVEPYSPERFAAEAEARECFQRAVDKGGKIHGFKPSASS